MEEVPVQILSIHVAENLEFKPYRITVELTDAQSMHQVGEWFATSNLLGEAGQLAEQALWSWISTGQVGLVAYLMSRPYTWSELPNF